MKTMISQLSVNNVRIFTEAYTDLLQNWHRAGRFTMNTNADRITMEDTWKELVDHTGRAGSPANFGDALISLRDGHRWRADDKTVMQIIAVMNLYGITMYLECIVAANFATLYAQNPKESETWRGTFINKLDEIAIFLEGQTGKLDRWIKEKYAERQRAIGDFSDNTESKPLYKSSGFSESGSVYVEGYQYTKTYQFKDTISDKTYKGHFVTKQISGSKRSFAKDESDWENWIRSVRAVYQNEVRLHCERRFATLEKAVAVYSRIASEMRAFYARTKAAEIQGFPNGVQLYELLIGKADNPTLIGPGGVRV